MKIELGLTHKTVPIQIKKGLFAEINTWLPKVYAGQKVCVLTDENVDALYGDALMDQLGDGAYKAAKMVIQPGEESKSLSMVEKIYSFLIDQKMTRKDLLLILGGGVVGDLGGFVAATYLRGVDYLQIPTTLLAQVDSSVGGKVGINLAEGKNLAGSFYHPQAIWIDPNLLDTLAEREFRSGMAEIIKYACIDDEPLFSLINDYYDQPKDKSGLLLEMIARSVAQKVGVVSQDEKEGGRRKILNFGHTLGHAIENTLGYGQISHGEAVAIGMAHFTQISEQMGISSAGSKDRLLAVLDKAGLASSIPETLSRQALVKAISHDKKAHGDSLSIILLKRIGQGFIKEIDRSDIEKYI